MIQRLVCDIRVKKGPAVGIIVYRKENCIETKTGQSASRMTPVAIL